MSIEISKKQQDILQIFLRLGVLQSSDVYNELIKHNEDVSLITVKRSLSEMASLGILTVEGAGRSTTYTISTLGRLFIEVNPKGYCSIEPDKRFGLSSYTPGLFSSFPNALFTPEQILKLQTASFGYRLRAMDLPPTIEKKELERLVIELSWKSSRIEGNTYTLLDTERLILNNIEAVGHSKDEAQMILNHKDAFLYVRENVDLYNGISRANIEELHSILTKGLGIRKGFRKRLVGVIGSKFMPLDNYHQISEAVNDLAMAINRMETVYDKALLTILGISIIQPFEDGNKRTARIMANAILLANLCAPLSYRSVDEVEYREAILVFYELNSIIPLRNIFIEQYLFAAKSYAVTPS